MQEILQVCLHYYFSIGFMFYCLRSFLFSFDAPWILFMSFYLFHLLSNFTFANHVHLINVFYLLTLFISYLLFLSLLHHLSFIIIYYFLLFIGFYTACVPVSIFNRKYGNVLHSTTPQITAPTSTSCRLESPNESNPSSTLSHAIWHSTQTWEWRGQCTV